MKISAIQAIPINIPIKAPLAVAQGVNVGFAKDLVVLIETDEGITGIGETAPRERITGEDRDEAVRFLNDRVLPNLVGAGVSIENLWQILDDIEGHHSAIAAVDIAFYDALAKAANVPLYHYLGGKVRERLPTARSVSLSTPEEMAKEALGLKQQGYIRIKVKVGTDPQTDIARVAAVRNAVGPDIAINIDANQSWTVDEAIMILQEMDPYEIFCVEQPVAAKDIEGLRTVRDAIKPLVMADEAVSTPEDARKVVEAEAVDMVNLKLEKSGGITPILKISSICETAGVPCQLGDAVTGGILTGAGIHVACATENIRYFEFGCGPFLRVEDFTDVGQYFFQGVIRCIENVGIGLNFDLKKVKVKHI